MSQQTINRYHETRKATLIGAAANIVLAVAKVLFGWLGHSSALVADGIHSFSDLLTDILVIVAAKFAHQEADDDHPYGHDRIETAATVGLAMLLIVVGLYIVYHPIQALITHQKQVMPDVYVLWIAVFSVVVNEIIYRYTMSVAKRINSDILRANALHSRSDAASSLVVLVGVAGSIMGITWLDEIAAIVVGIMIVKMGVSIGWQNISELVDTGVDEDSLETIRDHITSVTGVEALHQLRTRKMAGKVILDVHVIVNDKISVSEGHYIGDQVLSSLYKNLDAVHDVTVHVDSEDDELYSDNACLPAREQLLSKLRQTWQGLPGADLIENIQIHYIQGKIALELVLPWACVETQQQALDLQQRYQDMAQTIPELSTIKLLFTA